MRAPLALGAVTVVLLTGCGERGPVGAGGAGSGAGSSGVFRDVAAAVGLNFVHVNGATGGYYLPEIVGSGAALFDYDSDGDLDVYLIQSTTFDPAKGAADLRQPPPAGWPPRNRLYRNELISVAGKKSPLSFTDVTEASGLGNTGYGLGVAVGDYDNDGHLDVYVTKYGPNVLFHNNGNGTFSDVTALAGVGDPQFSTSAAFFDADADGLLDLYVANYVGMNLGSNKICNSPVTGNPDYCSPKEYRPVRDTLYRNLGNGSFADVTVAAGMSATFGSGLGVAVDDLDGDGSQDVFVANDERENQLWLNDGKGAFRDVAPVNGCAVDGNGKVEACMGVSLADFDRDGDADIFVTNLRGQTHTLYRNNGKAFFDDVTFELGLGDASMASTGFATAWFDYDNDGLEDLFVANGEILARQPPRDGVSPYGQPSQLFRQEPSGKYRDMADTETDISGRWDVSRGAAFGDVDNDGDVDVLVTNNNGPVRLLLNGTDSSRHWLTLSLKHPGTNLHGVGAIVTLIRTDGTRVRKRCGSDGSYLSASDLRVHFGLGDAKSIRGIEVRWPDGKVELWPAMPLDQLVVLTAGEGGPVSPK